MCTGDMVFYWIKQDHDTDSTYIRIGEGPKYNELSLQNISVSAYITTARMYGLMTEAIFMIG